MESVEGRVFSALRILTNPNFHFQPHLKDRLPFAGAAHSPRPRLPRPPKLLGTFFFGQISEEAPSKGLEATTKYQFLLPYFVLGGLAGMRTCELVRSNPGDPILNWEDILWAKNLILVRHEVAKQTRSRDHKRYIPLEPHAAAFYAQTLKPDVGHEWFQAKI